MAKINQETQGGWVEETEVFNVELNANERAAFRSSPEAFLKDLLEREGRKVNGIAIDARLLEGDGEDDFACPRTPKLLHIAGGLLNSNYAYICPTPI
ncbi:hypothetical protein AB0D10_28720 [Kitasatospora sp. NPDC048545]|uniref:hypothetical protein n=1 Tax=Kitasatospora sp. NPDC048545 TaxID=3157208 RepID=UPI0034034048